MKPTIPRIRIRAVPTDACTYKCRPHATCRQQEKQCPCRFGAHYTDILDEKLYKFVLAIIETQKHVHPTLLKKKNLNQPLLVLVLPCLLLLNLWRTTVTSKRFFSMFYFVNFIIQILHLSSIWPK